MLIRALAYSRGQHEWRLDIEPELAPQVAKVFVLTGLT